MEDRKHDSASDPSLDDGSSADWTAEGGATPSGPATDPEDASANDGGEEV